MNKLDKSLKNVSKDVIYRGEHSVIINNITYNVNDYDAAVTGNSTALYQSKDKELVIANADGQYEKICPIDAFDDFNMTKYQFVPKGETSMISEKVVGTTFKFKEYGERHYSQFAGVDSVENGIPVRTGQAVLLPEPQNQYDANAIAVVAAMADGSSFPLGYLGRGSTLYNEIKKPTLAKLVITAYSEGGDFNDSYVVEI